jgi:Asp-tRNA(Asn)/Glu-tRNA(Gln) amidotransferase A subunit family amidase
LWAGGSGRRSRACRFFENIEALEEAGFQVNRIPAFPEFEATVKRHYLVVAAEAARVHAGWFSAYGDLYHPKTAELIERGMRVTTDELVLARQGRAQLREHIGSLMDANAIDLWVAPSAPGIAPDGLESTGDPVMNLPWTQAGVPVFSLPAGASDEGLPYGLQVIGRFGQDEALTSFVRGLARAVEGQTKVIYWESNGDHAG